MASSDTTLADLWVNDGTSSPTQTVFTTPSKGGNGAELKDVLQFYKDSGLGTVAKEVGILDANGELAGYKQDQNVQPKQAIQMIAVPVHSSPARSAQQLQTTPRTIKVATPVSASPVQVISAQNLLQTTQVMGPRGTPQLIATPVQLESPSPQTWSASGARKRMSSEFMDQDFEGKRRKGEKGGKGLRHFSMKVCEKVQKKGTTSYNEVADELVAEFTDPRNANMSDQAYDQKNIRRRVYDALNVLMAMNIISKEKKEIKWIGLPTNSAQECQNLELEKQRRLERIKHKTQQLQELILQQIAFKNLVQRNRQLEQSQGAPTANSAIQLPFIIVNTSKKTVIDCSISSDKCEYLFNFNNTFEIHDDIEVLKRMGMAYGLERGQCNQADLSKAVKMVPRSLEPYVTQLARSTSLVPIPTTSILPEPARSQTQPLLSAALGAGPSHDQSLDAEVAMATGYGISRQSSLGSFSRDSPEDGYSDGSESERSSPVDLHCVYRRKNCE